MRPQEQVKTFNGARSLPSSWADPQAIRRWSGTIDPSSPSPDASLRLFGSGVARVRSRRSVCSSSTARVQEPSFTCVERARLYRARRIALDKIALAPLDSSPTLRLAADTRHRLNPSRRSARTMARPRLPRARLIDVRRSACATRTRATSASSPSSPTPVRPQAHYALAHRVQTAWRRRASDRPTSSRRSRPNSAT